jgi:O-antigen ligase
MSTIRINDRPVFYAFLALLVWAPLPLASNRTWAVGLLLFCMLMLFASAAWSWRHHPAWLAGRLREFAVPLALVAAFVAWAMIQCIPLPAAWVAALSPETALVRAAVLPGTAAYPLSLDPLQTWGYAMAGWVYLGGLVLALLLVRNEDRLERLARTLVLSGVLQALIGILLFSFHARYRLFFVDFVQDRVRGTFVYHNHMAGYMEMCLSVGIGLMLAKLGGGSGRFAKAWKERGLSILQFVLSPKMRLRLLLIVMVIALVLTRSRMGNTAFFAAMLAVGVLMLVTSRRTAPATVTLIASLIIIDVVVIGSWVGLEKVVERIQDTTLETEVGRKEESVEQRTLVARQAQGLVRDFPVTGTGGSSFYNAYARYRSGEIGPYFDHAHNDYVEIAADNGLPAMALLGLFVLLAAIKNVRVLIARRNPLVRGMAFASLMAIVAIAIHSFVDFNLQATANALTCTIVVALAWIAAAIPSGRDAVPPGVSPTA